MAPKEASWIKTGHAEELASAYTYCTGAQSLFSASLNLRLSASVLSQGFLSIGSFSGDRRVWVQEDPAQRPWK